MNFDVLYHFGIFQNLSAKYGIEKSPSIVSSENTDVGLILIFNSGTEVFEDSGSFILVLQKKHPCKPCMIIDESNEPMSSIDIIDMRKIHVKETRIFGRSYDLRLSNPQSSN